MYIHYKFKNYIIALAIAYFAVPLLAVAFAFIDFFLVISTLSVIARNTQLTCRDHNYCKIQLYIDTN